MIRNLLTIFFLGCSTLLWSQEKTVNGSVTDSKGVPLPGTNVLVVGTTNGTQSDFDGNYSIKAMEGQTLKFSYIGFKDQSVVVGNSNSVKVILEEDASQLEEVVVVGYGTQKIVNLTGSVETVKADEITRQPVAQASQALAGLVPGLTATQSSGQPGGDGAVLRIRGVGTLGNGDKNNPLILIDGIPDDINGLDPSDIESISVLKDASASAIYGSRAANGVILITTKRGKEGKLTTTYNTYVGVQSIAQNLKFLDALEYMEAFNTAQPGAFDEETLERYRAGGPEIGTEAFPDTDWVDLLFSSGAMQQYHNLSVRGGSEKTKISTSISYTDQDGNVPNFNFKRYNGRFNLDFKLSNKLDLAFDLNFRREVRSQPGALNGITRQVYRLQPLFVAINDDGTFGPGFGSGSPIAGVNSGSLDERITSYFRGVIKATYRPFNNFSIAATYSPQYTDRDQDRFNTAVPIFEFSGGPRVNPIITGSLFKQTFTSFQDNFNAIANYSKDFGNHSISGLVGYEFLKFESERWQAERSNFPVPEFRTLENGDVNTQLNTGDATRNGLESVFGRINYSYMDKYLLEANVRRDASSRFGQGFRSSTFPSFSVGWVVSNENFLKDKETLSFLKFRGSWGQLGNQGIFRTEDDETVPVNFGYTSQIGLGNADTTLGGVAVTGGAQTVLANPQVQWETGESWNLAIDAKLFNNKMSLTGEYYVRTTKDILLSLTVPPSLGLEPATQNVGSVENRGYDISVGWNDGIGDNFSYGINFNFSDFDNEITDLGNLDQLPPGNNTINRLGGEIGAIYGLKVDGLYQEADFDTTGALNPELPVPSFGNIQAGDIKYIDISGPDGVPDGIINNDDRTTIGSNITNRNWGLELFTKYKGIDLSVSLIAAGGRDVVLQGDVGYAFFNAGKIQEWQAADFWTPTNTDAAYPRLHPASSHPNWRTNETWQFDTSYVRLRNITLGYNLPRGIMDAVNVANARVYVSGQNLVTWDKLPDGIDPLTPNFSSGAFYPITKVFSLGLNVTF